MANKNRFCKCTRYPNACFYLHNGICKSCGLPEETLDAKKIAVVLRHRLKSLSGAKKMLSEAEEVKLIEQAILRYGAKVRQKAVNAIHPGLFTAVYRRSMASRIRRTILKSS